MNILLANFTKMIEDTGGVAKVNVNFANEMHRRGHQVTIVYSDGRQGDFFYPLDEGIPAFDLQRFGGKTISFPVALKIKRELLRPIEKKKAMAVNDEFIKKYLLKNIKEILERTSPDIIITFQPAASKSYLCDLHTDIPVITMSHGDPEDYFHNYAPEELPALEKSAVCQVLVPSFADTLKRHNPKIKTIVIGNVVPQYDEQADLMKDKERYKIIFMGRLAKSHKRPHLLVKAFEKIAADFPEWDLELWGAEDGKAYKKQLEALISRSGGGEKDRIRLMGTTNKVQEVYHTGDIFAFPSAYEGFGLSLAEAMSMGLPAVGYKNCPAVNEIIRDGQNGFLCADGVASLADALSRLMQDRMLRVKLGQQAREDMKQYAADIIWGQWEELMSDVIG